MPPASLVVDPTPVVPPLPPVPTPPSGWTSLASTGGAADPVFVGFSTGVDAKPLALHVACVGTGTLVVIITRTVGAISTTGEDAVVFPCSTDSTTDMRHELGAEAEAGSMQITGAVIEGMDAIRPTVFQVSLEQAGT
jgi:hypothetical protein